MTDVAVLSCNGLSKSFGALHATRHVSLGLHSGEVHALIGPNGAGKSTLIAQIAGTLSPDTGAVHFLGENITTLDAAARARRGLGRSFQISAVLPEFTVLQNVMLAVLARQRRLKFLQSALRDRNARHLAEKHAARAGLQERLPVRAAELSHAERRKLELAMAMAMSAKALLLDEPMAGMGAEGTEEMTALLADLRQDVPILLVEHDMDAVFALADRITVLNDGAVLASGTVQEIRSHPEVRRAYLGEEEAT